MKRLIVCSMALALIFGSVVANGSTASGQGEPACPKIDGQKALSSEVNPSSVQVMEKQRTDDKGRTYGTGSIRIAGQQVGENDTEPDVYVIARPGQTKICHYPAGTLAGLGGGLGPDNVDWTSGLTILNSSAWDWDNGYAGTYSAETRYKLTDGEDDKNYWYRTRWAVSSAWAHDGTDLEHFSEEVVLKGNNSTIINWRPINTNYPGNCEEWSWELGVTVKGVVQGSVGASECMYSERFGPDVEHGFDADEFAAGWWGSKDSDTVIGLDNGAVWKIAKGKGYTREIWGHWKWCVPDWLC